ncbi:MAG: SGNH/GDSL hydrolase family protein [Myxococcales bacterium]|nr:SGNH/GDSL hydrolase family protein [Myxococcales bacterium]
MTGRRRRVAFGFGMLAAAELGARLYLFATAGEGRVLIPDSDRLWRLAPPPVSGEKYRVDDDDFRASSVAAPADAPLILTLGDSSIFGHAVLDGETIHDAMQASLAASGVSARLRCLAVPGYSSAQTLRVMDELGWSLAPRALVIGSLWSDSTLDIVRDADLYAAFADPVARAELLLSKLSLFRVTRRTLNGIRGLPAERIISWPQPGDTGVRRVPVEDYAANLESMVSKAQEHGMGVVILALANSGMIGRGRGSSDPVYPYQDVQYRVAEAHNLPYVDMVRVFRDSGMTMNQLYLDELHPSGTGATLLGQAVAGALVDTGFPRRVTVPTPAPPVLAGPDPWDGAAAAHRRSVAGDLATGNL